MTIHAKRSFESIVLNIACVFGALRMSIALYRNVVEGSYLNDIVIDLAIFGLLVAPLVLSRTSIKFNYIAIPFCIVLGLLVSLSWLTTGGLVGTAEYNMMAVFFLFAMLFKGRILVMFLTGLWIHQILLLYIWNERQDLVRSLNEAPPVSTEPLHFILMSIAITISMFYLKNKFDQKRSDFEDKRKELNKGAKELDRQNILLVHQKNELELVNKTLEEKVNHRSQELIHKNGAIEEYFYVSLKGINDPLKKTCQSIDSLQEDHGTNDIVQLLVQSAKELMAAVEDVADKLQSESSPLDEDEEW